MIGHAAPTIDKRSEGLDDARQEIQGKLPKSPFGFAADLTFADVKPPEEPPTGLAGVTKQRYQAAIYRDARYAAAGNVWMMAHGMSQMLREIYDGSKILVDGGMR